MSKPWNNEPTPLTDGESCRMVNWYNTYGTAGCVKIDVLAVPMLFARNLERRMRAAERLLEDERREAVGMQFDLWCREADAHLEAAKKEDKQ